MIVAAYVVGGFLIASVYAVGMLRGPRRPLPPARLHHPVHRGGHRHPDPDGRRRLARPVGLQQPADQVRRHRARAADRASDVPETLLGHLNADGTVTGGIPIPGLASWLSDPSTGTNTVVQGLDTVPGRRRSRPIAPGQHRPPGVGRHGRPRHAAVPALGLVRRHLAVPATTAADASGSCASPRRAGVLSVITMEAGLGRHRGRPPTLDRLQLHEGRGRRHRQHRRLDHLRRRRRALHRPGRHDDPRAARA